MNVSTIRLIGGLAGALLAVIPFWKIFTKAGFSGWLALLAVIPLVNLVVLYYGESLRRPAHNIDSL